MKAIVVSSYGGAEVLQYSEVPVPEPNPGEARIQLEAIGVNFIDVYHRTGLYPIPLPFIPGSEGAGVIDAVDASEPNFKVGDRVAYTMAPGSYAEYAVVPIGRLIKIPDELGSMHAAAIMLQGMTVHYLTHSTYMVKPGDSVLIHAAAGGVGLLLVQVCKHLGAFVIGTVSSNQKAAVATDAGADHIIIYTQQDFVTETMKITSGRGVDVVYDSVGKTTFEKGLECLRTRGFMVLFGQSSGPVPLFNAALLAKKSLFLTRPALANYTLTAEELAERSGKLLDWISRQIIRIHIDQNFPLSDAAEAHKRLESRASMGKILLLP